MEGRLFDQIGAIHDSTTLPYLEKFAVSPRQRLRMEALQALRAIADPRSASTFLKELDDEDADNGFSAMQGLLELGGAVGQLNGCPLGANSQRHERSTRTNAENGGKLWVGKIFPARFRRQAYRQWA